MYRVPKTGTAHSIFSAALWVGGMVEDVLHFSGADYGPWEFWAGPLDASGAPPTDCAPYDRIYKVSKQDLINYKIKGLITDDLADWPVALGAPVVDGDGVPGNYNLAGGDLPQLMGDQTLWWVMNDRGNWHAWSLGEPLGLEIHATAFAYDHPGPFENTTFYKYTLHYKGTQTITDFWFGMWTDTDLGHSFDDYTGSDSTRSLGYAWNGDDFDEGNTGYGDTPPAVGLDFVQGLLSDMDGTDNDRDGTTDEAGERTPVSMFTSYNNETSEQGNPDHGEDAYRYLQSRWLDDVPITYGGTGRGHSATPVRFMYPDDPPAFWSESNIDDLGTATNPADRRFVVAAGPSMLQPGEVRDVILAIVWARGADRFKSVQSLKIADDTVQAAFDAQTIAYPPIQINPPDAAPDQPTEVLLTWAAVPGLITAYDLEWDTDPTFSNPNQATTANTLYTLTNLLPGTTYSWRVRAAALNEPLNPWSDVHTFSVASGPNAAPFVLNPIQNHILETLGLPLLIDLETSPRVFFDPNDDPLTYQTVSSDPINVASAELAGSVLIVSPLHQGQVTITVTAQDPGGLSVDETFEVTVLPEEEGRLEPFLDFLVVENAGGVLDPPEYAAFAEHGFPTVFTSGILTDRQQVGPAKWAFATHGTGQAAYETFKSWVVPTEINGLFPAPYDFEMRFTTDGGYCYPGNSSEPLIPVPFELWRTGTNTPNDPSDDVRLTCWVWDRNGEGTFNLSEPDHDASDGLDDPYTDRFYWYVPADDSPGTSGYEADLEAMNNRTYRRDGSLILSRTVLVNVDGGTAPPYNQALPEEGTVFRIIGGKPVAPEVNVWLQGPYADGTMHTELNRASVLPLTQPFDHFPWFYFGPEQVDSGFFDAHPEIVDWVLLHLRTGDPEATPMQTVASRAAFLKADGQIVDTDGMSKVVFTPEALGPYHLVVKPRNHIPVMSNLAFSFFNNPAIDFTTSQTAAFGNYPMVELDERTYGLYGGDGDANGNVTAFDFLNIWLPQNGQTGYLQGDFNLSSDVTAFDFLNVWLTSNGRGSQVPE